MRIRLRCDLATQLDELSPRARGRVITAAVAAQLDDVRLPGLAAGLEELRKIGINLNQIARRVNSMALIDEQDVNELIALTKVVRALIR